MKKLTVPERWQAGNNLVGINVLLTTVRTDVANTYGRSSVPAKELDKALRALLLARSELENLYTKENPSRIDNCHVYFGTDESRAQRQSLAEQVVAKSQRSV